MKNQKKGGAILGYAAVLTKNVVNLIYVPLLLHFLGQSDYGVFQMTNSVVFALVILSAGFYGSYVRFYMRERAKGSDDNSLGIRRLNGMFLLIYFLVALLCILGSVILIANVHVLFSGGLTSKEIILARELMVIMGINVAVTLLSTPFDSYIVAHEKFVFQQSRQLFTTLAQPFLAVLLLEIGMGAIGVACAQLMVSTILLIWNACFATRRLGMRFTFIGLEWSLFKAIALFSFWIFLNQIVDMVNNNMPNFLLGAMSSSAAVAVFAIAVQIRNVFFSMSTTMSNMFIPQINRIVAETDDNSILTHLMTRVGRYQMVIFWYLFGGFAVLGKFFVELWAGKSNLDAYWLALVMSLPVMIPLTQTTGIEIQRAKNRHKVRSVIYIFTALIDIIVSVLLIPSCGYWATAIGYVLSIVLGTGFFMNWYYHTRIGLDMFYFWKQQLPTIVFALVIVALCLFGVFVFPITSIPMFILWGIVYTALFGVCAMRFSFSSEERKKLHSFLCKKLKR